MGMTVVIPSLGLQAMLRSCLDLLTLALARAEGEGHRVVVVDNASPHPYLAGDLGEGVEVVRLDTPRSFSNACNRGAAAAPNEVFLFLNNDVLLHRNAIRDVQATMATTGAAICGARLVYPDDTIQHCGVRFGTVKPAPYHEHHRRPTHTVPRHLRDFQAVTGACMAVTRPAFETLGGFDEVFPFAFEDVDLCLRARARGLRVTCAQAVDSIHFESQTPGREARELGSRAIFEQRWDGRYMIDATEETRL